MEQQLKTDMIAFLKSQPPLTFYRIVSEALAESSPDFETVIGRHLHIIMVMSLQSRMLLFNKIQKQKT